MLVEFWVLNSGSGTLRCPLPDVESWSISPISNDAGAISFTYPVDGLNWDVLNETVTDDTDMVVQVRVNGVVQPELQATILESAGDDVADGAVWTYTGTLALGRLVEGIVEPQGGMPSQGDDSTLQNDALYYSCTAGTIMATMMAEAAVRDALNGVTYASFTGTQDSNGAAWTQIITLKFSPALDYLKVIQGLVEAGMCEAKMVGLDLRLYEPGTLGSDLTLTDPPVVFRKGQSLLDSPRRHTVRETATAALVAGAEGVYQWVTDAAAETRRGRRIEVGTSQGQISDDGTLLAYAQHYLSGAVTGRMEKTHGLSMAEGPLPILDFNIGDWVWSDLGSGLEKLRVAQWALSGEPDGTVSGQAVLNDLMAEREAALAKRLRGIEGGTTITGTSNARQIPDDMVDGVPPGVPEGLTISSVAYITSEGTLLSAVTVEWDAVTFNSNGTAMTDMGYYSVYWRYTNSEMHSGNPLLAWTLAATTEETFAHFSAVRPGELIEVRVGAVDDMGNFSGWSDIESHTTAVDTIAPPTPSQPIVTALIGAIRIEWDGEGSLGEAMPADFKHVEIHVSTVDNFTPSSSTLYDIAIGALAVGYTKGAYGVAQFARFVSVDTSGNKSSASADATATPRQILNPDIADVTIGSAKIADLDVGKLITGTLTAVVTLSGDIRTAASGPRFGLNSSEFYAYRADGTKTVSITNAGAASFLGEVRTAPSGARIITNPAGTNPSEMRFFPATDAGLGKYVSIFTSNIPNQTAGYTLFYIKGDRFAGTSGEAVLRMWHYEASFGWFNASGDILSDEESAVYAQQYFAGMHGSSLRFVAHGLRSAPYVDIEFSFSSPTTGAGRMKRDNLDAFVIGCPAKGSAFAFQGNHIFAVAEGNTLTHVGFTALTVTQSSGMASKTNIGEIEDDVLEILDAAPSKRWEYQQDHDVRVAPEPMRRRKRRKDMRRDEPLDEILPVELEAPRRPLQRHWGPMAEDLPEGVRVLDPVDGRLYVDHGSMMGLQWEILRRLFKRLKRQDRDLEDIKTHLGI